MGISKPKDMGGGVGRPVDDQFIWVKDLQSLAPEGAPDQFLYVFLAVVGLLFLTTLKSRVAIFGFSFGGSQLLGGPKGRGIFSMRLIAS